MARPQHFVFALVEEFTHLAFSCAIEPLRIANMVSGKELYRWSLASENGATATASNGSATRVDHTFGALPVCDWIVVVSGLNLRAKRLDRLITALRRARSAGTAIGAICSGAFVLAKAGLLDGRQAAIHWEYHDGFREEFPEVSLVQSVFVADGRLVTASGGTAAADLMLHLIERDHGYDLAVTVADQMVYNAVRGSAAAQRVSIQSRSGVRNPHLVEAIGIMRETLPDPIPPAEIAARIGISTRQLERLFHHHLATSPKRHFMAMRLERGQHLLLQTEAGITEIAVACGFASPSHFSRAYRAAFGVSPTRQRARATEGLSRTGAARRNRIARQAGPGES